MIAAERYTPRGRNELHTIFDRHFADFREQYDEKYAATYGRYRLERIQQIGEWFTTCGDYLRDVARIRCTNPECGHDYFRPFSCKGFYLCPSCSRLIYDILREFYDEATGRPLLTAMVIAHRRVGRHLMTIPLMRKTWVMNRCRTKTKRLMSTHANAPGRGPLRRRTRSIH